MILFFIEGTGLGHAARIWWAAKALDAVVVAFGPAVEFLQRRGVEVYSIRKPYHLHFGKDGLDLGKSLGSFLSMDVEELRSLLSIVERSSAVVVDSSILGLIMALYKKKPFLFISNATRADSVYPKGGLTQGLLDAMLRRSSALVVPDYPPPFTITLDNLHLPLERYTFLGPTVYVNDIKSGNSSAVVVNMGAGFEVSSLSLPFPAIVPKGFSAKGGKVVEDVRPHMGNARVVITHGGHSTIMEALALGKPLVVVPNPAYRERVNNAKGVERNNVGVSLPYSDPHALWMAVEMAERKKRAVAVYERAYRRMKGYKALVELVEELA